MSSWHELMWKLHNEDRNPLKYDLVDKLLVKEYAKQHGVATPQTYEVADSLPQLKQQILNNPNHPRFFCIKTSQDSKSTAKAKLIDGEIRLTRAWTKPFGSYDPRDWHIDDYPWYMQRWGDGDLAHQRHDDLEWMYRPETNRFYSEELLHINILNYKLIVVWGKAYFLYLNQPAQKTSLVDYYDREGNRLTVRQSKKYKQVVKHTPQNIPQVFDAAERLVSQFSGCRVDLYCENNTVYLGELTFDVSIPGIDEDLFKLCPVDKLI